MSLAQVEKLCHLDNMPWSKEKNGLKLELQGVYAVFPALVSEEERDLLQALVWFAPIKVLEVEKVEEFCSFLNTDEVFGPYAHVGFNRKQKKFWAGCLFKEDEIQQKLGAFVQVCDMILPLVTHIGTRGCWEKDLVRLACTTLDECCRA